MAQKRTKRTSEAEQKEPKNVSTSASEAGTLTLDEYLAKVKVNLGLIASFKYEASKDKSLLKTKSKHDWDVAFENQSNKTYK